MIRKLIFVLPLLLGSAFAHAASGDAAGDYAYVGKLDRYDPESRVIVVDDRRMSLADYALVHHHSKGVIESGRLRQGMDIGYNATRAGRGGGTIVELWILPKGYIDKHGRPERGGASRSTR